MKEFSNAIECFIIETQEKYTAKKSEAIDYYNAGLYNLDKYHLDQALGDFNTAIYFNNNNYKYYLMRGIVYSEKEWFKESLADLSRAKELNPQCQDVYNNRGYVYYKMKEYEKALEDWTISLTINPCDEFIARMQKLVRELLLSPSEIDHRACTALNL